jgi:hypothetical protein
MTNVTTVEWTYAGQTRECPRSTSPMQEAE